MKTILTCLVLLLPVIGFAQQQTYYYVKNNGTLVKLKDSADVIRVVTEPADGAKLFNVADYFTSGKKKQLYKSTSLYPVNIEGTMLSFFENGKRRSIEEYKDGKNIGSTYQYYPNGRIYVVKAFAAPVPKRQVTINNPADDYTIAEAYDSLGTATVINGNGPLTVYTEDFKDIAEQGEIKNGKRTGIWKGSHKPTNSTFEEEYVDGALKAGKAQYEGKTVNYAQRSTPAQFSGGDAAFGMYLARHLQLPAEDREKGLQGRVIVSFDVEKDGKLSNFQIVESVNQDLDNEAIRVLKSSPKWKPAMLYGQPTKVHYTVPIGFSVSTTGMR